MKIKMKLSLSLLITLLLLLNLTACSYIKSYFPDRSKDYQFAVEIPPLNIPTDIAGNHLEKKTLEKPLGEHTEPGKVIGEIPAAAATVPAQVTNPSLTAETTIAPTPVTIVPTPTPPVISPAPDAATPPSVPRDSNKEPVHIEQIKLETGDALQLNQPLTTAWNTVSKALARKGIEITRRDQTNAEFVVQYDPNAPEFKDESLSDKLAFALGNNVSQEKPYHIKLLATEKTTRIQIIADTSPPAVDASASLLKLLADTMAKE